MKTIDGLKWENLAIGLLSLAFFTSGGVLGAELNVPGEYPTIQKAVDTASSGDTIRIAPGVYLEQITIKRKNLTLIGVPGAVIRAQTGLSRTLHDDFAIDRIALLEIAASDVLVSGLRFEGEHIGFPEGFPAGGLDGIDYWGSNGTVTNCMITGFRDITLLDDFHSQSGLVIGNLDSLGTDIVTVNVSNNIFADNLTSISILGDDTHPADLRTNFEVEGNIITGIGPDKGSEHGIAINVGASGMVKNNTISDHISVGENGGGIGVVADDQNAFGGNKPLIPLPPIRYEGNTFRNNQRHIVSLAGDDAEILNNTFQVTSTTNRADGGVLVSGNDVHIENNSFTDMPTGILLIGNDPDYGTALGITVNPVVGSNRFCHVNTPIKIEDLVTGVEQQGTLLCPFPDPVLAIASAVILSWPSDTAGWILESASVAGGPWASESAKFAIQDGQNVASVKTDPEHRFFRLRKP